MEKIIIKNNKYLLDKFLEWEEKNNLDEIFVDNYPIWFLLRAELYNSILFKDYEFKNFKNRTPESYLLHRSPKIIEIINWMPRSIFTFLESRQIKILAFSYPYNRRKIDNYYFDIYYDELFDLVNNNCYILEFPGGIRNTIHYKNNYKSNRVVFGDLIYLYEIFSINTNIKNNKKLDLILNIYCKFFYKYTNIKPNINNLYKKSISRVNRNMIRFKILKNLLRKYSPSIILMKSAYSPGMQILTYFAKQLQIKVYEIQHAHIYSSHIGYNYNSKWHNKILPIPDKLLVFSNFYKEELLATNYWKKDDIITVGNPYLYKYFNRKEINELKNIKNNFAYIVLVVSQITVINKIIKFLDEIDKYPNILFMIKTHPNYYQEKFIFQKKLGIRKNLLITTKGNIFDYLDVCDATVGFYSTGLIDSLYAQVPTYIINIGEKNILDNLVKKNFMRYVNSLDELISLVKSSKKQGNCISREVYQKYSPLTIVNEIKKNKN